MYELKVAVEGCVVLCLHYCVFVCECNSKVSELLCVYLLCVCLLLYVLCT